MSHSQTTSCSCSTPANIVRFPVRLRLVRQQHAFRVSDDIQRRIYYPARVRGVASDSLFPLDVRHHADAVYENVARFLDAVRAEECFQ